MPLQHTVREYALFDSSNASYHAMSSLINETNHTLLPLTLLEFGNWHHPCPIYAQQVLKGFSPVHCKAHDFEGCCRSNPKRDVATKRKAKGEGVLGNCSILIPTYFFNMKKMICLRSIG
jgi:hypothetical protein